jgi:3-deoxy-7-phosphoheptulonate synthase
MSARTFRREDTQIDLGDAVLGGGRPLFMAQVGRHARREALLDHARALAQAGAHALRLDPASAIADVALGEPLFALLEEVAKLSRLALALEVTDPRHVDALVRRADLLVVPAPHMADEALLREVGRLDRPVLLERGTLATLDEWLSSADRILERGNHRVVLGEVGSRSLDPSLARTLDVTALLALRDRSHLPVVVDPTRAGPHRGYATPLAQSALAAGAHGLCLKVAFGAEAGDHGIVLSEFAALAAP